MSKELTTFNEKDIKESQIMAGQSSFSKFPFVPIVTVNNKAVLKTAVIDGVETEVKVPAKKGFIMLEKNKESGEMEEKFLDGNITGVILKERFMIEKKFVKDENQYRSDEFDGWDSIIELYEKGNRKNVLFQGKYSQIKEAYTSEDDKGKKKKDFDLFVILYVNLEMTGTIVRVKLKMTGDNNWFDYKSSFGDQEPWAGYVTLFNLIEKKVGDITYWHSVLEKGQAINLSEQLVLQKELNKFFAFTSPKKVSNNDVTYEKVIDATPVDDQSQLFPVDDEGLIEVPGNDEINVDDIPF